MKTRNLSVLKAAGRVLVCWIATAMGTQAAGTQADPAAERNPRQIEEAQKQVSTQFMVALEMGQLDEAVGMMSPTLQPSLSNDKLDDVWKSLVSRYGAFRNGRARRQQRFGNQRLFVIDTRWEHHRLEIRLSFNKLDQIDGLWVDRPSGSDEPTDFPSSKYVFGETMRRAAGAQASLETHVLDLNGKPVAKSMIRIWQRAERDEAADEADWIDPQTNECWRSVAGAATSDRMTTRLLAPGMYRATARAGHNYQLPFGISQPIQLNQQTQHGSVTVRLKRGATLKVQGVDSGMNQPLESVFVSLQPLRGVLPPNTMIRPTQQADLAIFQHLPAGEYAIRLTKRARRPGQLQYDSKEQTVVIKSADDVTELKITMAGRKLTPEEISQRWPWIAQGVVLDEDQRPVKGAVVQAYAGWGSLRATGQTQTDEQGHYTLRFGPGVSQSTDAPNATPLNLQAAIISARKDGYVEQNMNRQGDLQAANRAPTDADNVPFAKLDRIMLPDKPRKIDFVLTEAAQVEVTVIDEDMNPIASRRVRIAGKSLPPASSVLASLTTDEQGKCTFDGVPPNLDWWFSVELKGRKFAKSPTTRFDPGTHKVRVQLSPASGRIKILD